jgi:flap endonuclease-1
MARIGRREAARAQWERAKLEGDEEEMRIKAQASTRITKEVVASSMELLDCLGIGYIKAPSEGEAQASVMAADGVVYAAGSQDYDTLLFGAPRIVRNLTFSGRRKLPRKNVYINVETEIIDLNNTLSNLGITREQLIWLGILIGTDFNEGIDKVGPKTALKISKSSSSIEDVKRYVEEKLNRSFDVNISEVESLFINPDVRHIDLEEIKSLTTISCNKQATVEFMCNRHGFLQDRIEKFVNTFESTSNKQKQKGIDAWLSG